MKCFYDFYENVVMYNWLFCYCSNEFFLKLYVIIDIEVMYRSI